MLPQETEADSLGAPQRRRSMLQQQSGKKGLLSDEPYETRLAELSAAVELVESSLARTAVSLEAAAGHAAVAYGSSPRNPRDGFMAFLEDAKGYKSTVEEGGTEVLRLAEEALQRTKALASGLAVLQSSMEDGLAMSNALLSGIMGQMEALSAVLLTDEDNYEAAPCLMDSTGGSVDIEFSIQRFGVENLHEESRRRSLLISGGKSSSGKKSASTKMVQEEHEDVDPKKAAQAAGAALSGDSWNLMKQYAADGTMSMLPERSTAPSAMSFVKDGVLLHLKRKVMAC